ncbi:MAG: hypothetical protein R2734_17200 [Nocardioides sp.]
MTWSAWGTWATAGLALVVALGGCADAPHSTSPSGEYDGLVRFAGAEVVQTSGVCLRRPRLVAFGATLVENTSDQPATLREAVLLPSGAEGARLVRVLVRDVSHGEDMLGAGPWPDPEFTVTRCRWRGTSPSPAARPSCCSSCGPSGWAPGTGRTRCCATTWTTENMRPPATSGSR